MININGLLPSRKTPGAYLVTILGGPGTSPGSAAAKLLIVGNKITSALSGASPSFSVSAGTQADASPIQILSTEDAAGYFGRGSELHRMARSVFEQFPDCELWAASTAEAGSAGTAVLTFATAASAAFTVRILIGHKVIDVSVASGDSVTTIAAAVANAILDIDELPITAQNSSGVLTLTAKHPGPRGNNIAFLAYFVTADGRQIKITASSTSSGAGTACTISGHGTLSSVFTLSGGATQDSVTNVLTAIASTTYARIAWAHSDSTNIPLIASAMDSSATVLSQRRQQSISASNASLGSATPIATTPNAARLQVVWHHASMTPAEETAAQVAAGRLAGSPTTGIEQVGELTDPACNLDGLTLATVRLQVEPADRPTETEVESALAAGLTPVVPADGGRVAIARSVTTRTVANTQPNYAVYDTTDVTVPDFVADDLRSRFSVDFRAKKLVPTPAEGETVDAPNCVHAQFVRAWIKSNLKSYEARGIIREVDDRDAQLVVAENVSVAGRLDAEIPTVPVPGFHQFGANVRQLSPAVS